MTDKYKIQEWVKRFLIGTFFRSGSISTQCDLTHFIGSKRKHFQAYSFQELNVEKLSSAAPFDVIRKYIPILYEESEYINKKYFELSGNDFYIEVIVNPSYEQRPIVNTSFRGVNFEIILKDLKIVSFDYIGNEEKIRNILTLLVMSQN